MYERINKINLQIADSYYPLTINRDEEETVREAAKQVNIRLNAYREHYRNVAPEKIIAMVAYQFHWRNYSCCNVMIPNRIRPR